MQPFTNPTTPTFVMIGRGAVHLMVMVMGHQSFAYWYHTHTGQRLARVPVGKA